MSSELILHDKVKEADGAIIEVKVWSVPVTNDRPHGYKYSLVYVKDGIRIAGYYNHEGTGDHRHYSDKEEPYKFKSIDQLFEDLMRDVRRFKKK